MNLKFAFFTLVGSFLCFNGSTWNPENLIGGILNNNAVTGLLRRFCNFPGNFDFGALITHGLQMVGMFLRGPTTAQNPSGALARVPKYRRELTMETIQTDRELGAIAMKRNRASINRERGLDAAVYEVDPYYTNSGGFGRNFVDEGYSHQRGFDFGRQRNEYLVDSFAPNGRERGRNYRVSYIIREPLPQKDYGRRQLHERNSNYYDEMEIISPYDSDSYDGRQKIVFGGNGLGLRRSRDKLYDERYASEVEVDTSLFRNWLHDRNRQSSVASRRPYIMVPGKYRSRQPYQNYNGEESDSGFPIENHHPSHRWQPPESRIYVYSEHEDSSDGEYGSRKTENYDYNYKPSTKYLYSVPQGA